MRHIKNTKKTVIISIVVVALMFGFGFALVPLYDVFCDITGINGKTNTEPAKAAGFIDKNRWVTVQFITSLNERMPWQFYTKTEEVKVHPGERKRVDFYAKNISTRAITGQAVPSVAPGDAARYLLKTECFCFNQQKLKPGESMDMPMIFHIDPDLPKNIHTITLSYTMFDAGRFEAIDQNKQGRIG